MFVVERQEYALFLLRSFLLGAVLAISYLLFGFLRIPIKRTTKGVVCGLLLVAVDFPFCFLTACSNILVIYVSNRGQVRISALVFEVIGFCLLYLPLNRWTERMQYRIFSFLKNKIALPVFLFLSKKMRCALGKIRKRCLIFRLKRYNQKLDRLIVKAADEAIKNGEDLIFPEK